MADYNREYRRSTSSHKEDPRLRREAMSSPKHASSTATSLPDNNWQNQYAQPLQTAYQHLQTAMYGDTQYSTQGYQNTYAGYQAYPNSAYAAYDGYGQPQNAYVGITTGNIQPGPPGEEYPQGNWAPVGASYVNNQQQSLPAVDVKASASTNPAVAQEMKHQKAELLKQREEYERRITVLRRELELLRRQKQDLMKDSSDRDTELILRENGKLQVEIQNKLKDAYNVIEILTGIIGDNGGGISSKDEESNERASRSRRSHSVEVNAETKYNYVHYDPELHWCRMCDVFPKTAKDLLMHLHSKEHREMMQAENIEIPWHKLPPEPEFPYVEGAAKKRLPIKGLQFFVSATAWYCRLCDSWIGDLHCASQHLKSLNHSHNYSNFVEQNPHWEIEWLKDREKALERINRSNKSSDSEDNHEKKKKKHKSKYSPSGSSSKDKRKKKRSKKRKKDSSDSSSSSSSDSSSDDDKNDTSKSIHVAMRNKMKLQAQMIMNEELSGKWEALGRLVEEQKRKELNEMTKDTNETEDTLINQWMTVKQPQDKDKVLLDNLKDRLKQKQEAEKIKFAEMERKRREKEKEEQERKEKEELEAREREEQKQKEREEMERLKEDREQVKFRTKEKQQYRKRKSPSRSPEHKRRNSRSPRSSERHRKYDDDRRSYGISPEGKHKRQQKHEERDRDGDHSRKDKKPPPPPSYKKLPFIGRMPLFKNKKMEERVEKEIKKEDYDIPRQTRFQPGNLARAFIPEPEVCCFPKLSSYPPLTMPPPPAPVINSEPPAPPKISGDPVPKAPPPPKINDDSKKDGKKDKQLEKEQALAAAEACKDEEAFIIDDDDPLKNYHEPFALLMDSYPYDYNMMYPPNPPMFDYTQDVGMENGPQPPDSVPLSHTMPLQPPPLPPDDPNEDLALLGISSDDLAAAQMFKK